MTSTYPATYPNEWLCPITLQVMRDPVIGPDGHTYERDAIEAWLQQSMVSPVTRQRMSSNQLTPNIALRSLIESAFQQTTTQSGIAAFKQSPVEITSRRYLDDVGTNYVHVKARVSSAEAERQPILFLAILDNSGSMGEEAGFAQQSQGSESLGFTRLDLVKHAVKTIGAVLGDQDSLGIVTFSTCAKVVLSPIRMDAAGKERVNTALATVQPDSQTNIWDGIRLAATLANSPAYNGAHIVALLLTDGFPNVNPPRGIVPSLERLKMQNRWSLHTFGFGYNLDSALLTDISVWGKGIFGFIPDCSMVGTIFINFLANMLSTANTDTQITIDDGDLAVKFELGEIMYGQERDFIYAVPGPVKVNGQDAPLCQTIPEEEHARYEYLGAIAKAISDSKRGNVLEAQDILARFEVKYNTNTNPLIKAYVRDVKSTVSSEGQIGMSPANFVRWGEHYMRSYLTAQQYQQCMNFKDPGLQIYGGDLFHTIQEEADTAFITLPPPTPSRRRMNSTAPLVTSMNVFHNESNGCFHGSCKVLMADGTQKQIRNINPGDYVATSCGSARVEALVTCNTYDRAQPMVHLDGLCITPWHPIRMNGEWIFPADIVNFHDRILNTVYNLVLEHGHIAIVEGYECVTLGHNFNEPVVQHPYFGSDRIIRDLMKVPGWSSGRPTFTNLVALRDESGLICEWIDEP